MIRVALAPCSPFSVTPELMESSAALARSYGALLHTHLAETEDENDFCIKRFGLRPVDYLEKVGWLAGDVWLAHGIFFNENEIQRLGRAGIGVSHCPSSNMVLASGICEVNALEAAGVAVGLGVDGSASNDGSNMIQEVRQGFLLQRLKYGAAAVTHEDALRWATIGGARVLGQDQTTGSIEVGKKADLALFALDDLRFSGAGDALAALVLCGAHQVSHLMVNGDWRVRNGEIPGLDIHRLRAEHQQAADRLAARA
ncbi:amidohydrolase family protein [Teredinibacter turnerae]|uniref:amidohydrolase family protein n=1 Tax=Teredinibacter turnerae TaxID=2426 RepID=UPI0030D01A47